MLKTELQRGLRPGRWIPVLAASLFTILLSVQDGWKVLYIGLRGNSWYQGGSVNYLLDALRIDKYKLVFLILLTSIHTGSYCQDEKTRFLRLLLGRCSLENYVFHRFFANFVLILATTELVLVLYALVYRICGYPMINPLFMDNSDFYYSIEAGHPFVFLLMIGLVLGMQAAACSSIGLLFSAYQPNLLVSVGLCGVVYFLALSCIPSGIFSVMGITCMDCVLPSGTDTPCWLMFMWSMLYPGMICAVCCLLFYRKMRDRRENGEL